MSNEDVVNLAISATDVNEGKTTVTLGLTSYFAERLPKVGFIKPLSWSTVTKGGRTVDRDTLLIDRTCPVHCHIEDMSPVTLKGGFPDEYLVEEARQEKITKVSRAYDRVSDGKDMVVIEGSGNASAGESMGFSTAYFAGMFDSKAILVSSGGIGQPIDEILLNKHYFEKNGVELIGAIFNKVYENEMDKVQEVARRILEDHDIPFLGAIPYKEDLYEADLLQVVEKLDAQVLHGEENLSQRVGKIGLGAMTPQNAMKYLDEPYFIITPGDRQDLIFAALTAHLVAREDPDKEFELRGLMLTGGIMPDENILEIIRRTRIPVLMVEDDSYNAARKMNNMKVSINHRDKEKIAAIKDIVKKRVDVDRIAALLNLDELMSG